MITKLRVYFLSVLILIGFGFASILLFAPSQTNPTNPGTQRLQNGPQTGARQSLDLLSIARSYPADEIPAQGFTQAFDETRLQVMDAKFKGEPAANWQTMGPTNIGGRTLALAIHPTNPDIIFAGSASGGLWKSETGGSGLNAWSYVRTGFPALGVAAIAIDQENPDIMYIGTGESYGATVSMPGIGPVRTTRGSYGIGILKSTDGGQSWQKSLDWSYDQRRSVQKIAINPANTSTIWAATSHGTYRSYNSGQTWELVHEVVMATDVLINPVDTNVVFIANGGLGSEGHGVYRTTNGGARFSNMFFGVAGGPSVYQGKAVLAMSRSNPEVVMVSIGYSDGGPVTSSISARTWLLRTDNGGDTWRLVFVNDNIYASRQGWYSHAVAIHPEDDQIIWAAGQPFNLYKSTDGGENLDAAPTLPLNPPNEGDRDDVFPYLSNWADHHDIIFHPTNPDIIYFINDGGVFRTTDGGITIENCNSGYQTVQFYNGVSVSGSNPNLMLGGLQDNNSIIYEGTLDWRRGWAGDGAWTALNQNDNNVAYLSAQYGQAVASRSLYTDNIFGDYYTRPGFDVFPSSEANFITPFVLSPVDNKTLYMGGQKIYKSIDEGVNWSITNSGEDIDGNKMSAMAASHQDVNVVYAASFPGATRANVYRTDNGGNAWINITGNLPDRVPTDIVVDQNNHNRVFVTFAGFGSGHVYKTEDGGENWDDISSGLPDIPTWSVVNDPQAADHIFVGNELGIYRSLDGGTTWMNINGNLPDAVFAMDLVISPADRTLRVATHGNGAYQIELGLISSNESENTRVVVDFDLSQNYPNPFNPSTNITYKLAKAGMVSLKVYDLLGREVAELVNSEKTPGTYTVNFSGNGLASGTYLYRLQVGSQIVTKKMLLAK